MKKSVAHRAIVGGIASLVVLSGCISPAPDPNAELVPPSPKLAKAEALYNEGSYRDALIECVDLTREDPLMPGLSALRRRVMERLNEMRTLRAANGAATTDEHLVSDLDRQKIIPGTYGMRRPSPGDDSPLRTAPTAMQSMLDKPITVHLDNVTLSDFILAVGAADNINIIADAMDDGKTMTIHADAVPLSEVLDYVSRNLGVSFSVGRNIIWATPQIQSPGPTVPMETRMYRLRRGVSSPELGDAEGTSEATINIVETVKRFIPDQDGADLLFDSKAHVLIVKNTRPNLDLVEDIIEALDVCPPQVLVEARFIATAVNDLRELGIDWLLESPLVVTRTAQTANGRTVRSPRTQVAEGASINYSSMANDSQGMNLTYQGLLTEPMFQAVLHALDMSGKSRTLSVPKVTTVNNRKAKIRIGEDFRYFEEYDVQSVPGGVNSSGADNNYGVVVYDSVLVPVGSPTLEELGIELEVIPSVGADRRSITLKLVPEISEFKEWIEYEVAGRSRSNNNNATTYNNASNNLSIVKLPIFRRSFIETEVVVQSGETVVMGGLASSAENKTESSVPFLGAIPLLGALFRQENVEQVKQNLLIFVTATLLSDRGESLIPVHQLTPSEQPTAVR